MSDEEAKTGITIEFKDEGSVVFGVAMHGKVYPLQMIAVAAYLETIAKSAILEQRELGRIQTPRVPEPKIVLPGQG